MKKDTLSNQLALIFLVGISFVNGFLVANHFMKGGEPTDADVPEPLTDVFEEDNITPDEGDITSEETTTPEEEVEEEIPEETVGATVLQEVPFTTHGIGGWIEPWNDYAAQSVTFMAMKWVYDQEIYSAAEAGDTMLDMDAFLGYIEIPSPEDVLRLFHEYYSYENAYLLENPSAESIKEQLDKGRIVILPVNAQFLDNPYFKQPAATDHMILVIGYDESTEEFIVHDPGVTNGWQFRYGFRNIEISLKGNGVVVSR